MPAFTIVAALSFAAVATAPTVTLELRVFNGPDEVTAETRVTVHRSGDRLQPLAQTSARNGHIEVAMPPGIYDVQALREQHGRVLNIRWAERLVVMEYPDEAGRHLEVINFMNGYGALQVRDREANGPPEAVIYAPANHDRPAAPAFQGTGYVLFVVPSGVYDVQTGSAGRATWHRGVEVPLDRTRLWFVP